MAAEFVCRMLRMGRLPFLAGGFLLFCMGALAAVERGASPDPVAFWTGYTAFGLVHLSVSYSNEYFDRISDRAGLRTLISGGSGMLVRHPELAPAALKLALVLNALAVTLAASLAVAGIVSPLFTGMVGLGAVLGWWYSAPPLRLVGRGLGEVSTAVTLGALIPATGYLVLADRFDPALIPFLVPLLCYGMIFILSVELPDMEGDRLSGKRTFVVRYGRKASGWTIAGCAIAASLFYALYPWERGGFCILAALSLLIVGTAGAGVLLPGESRRGLVCRATANLASLNAFVLLGDLFLLAGIAS